MCLALNDMIPTIGFIIGTYVILRSLDLICAAKARYATEGVRVLMITACAITLGVTAFLLAGLLLQSSSPITPYTGKSNQRLQRSRSSAGRIRNCFGGGTRGTEPLLPPIAMRLMHT